MLFGEDAFTKIPTSAPDDSPTPPASKASRSSTSSTSPNGAARARSSHKGHPAAASAANGHANGKVNGRSAAATAPSMTATRAPARPTKGTQASGPANGHAKGRMATPRRDTSSAEQETLAGLRRTVCERFRPEVAAGAAPIRVMARMVQEVLGEARKQGLSEQVLASGVVNRTIGDVDLRRVSPADDGPEFVSLADDMGLALPGELIGAQRATGATYRWLHQRMLEVERALLARGVDLRMYDLMGVGNPILRELLAQGEHEDYGIALDWKNIYLSLGALDGLDKFWRGWGYALRQRDIERVGVVFPAPSFNVPEWQAVSLGYRLHRLKTRPEDHFKVTPEMLQAALDECDDLRAFYLTVSNNPTAFAYSYDELRALFAVVARARDAGRELLVVADLAYIGTGDPAADRRRMQAFGDAGILPQTVLVHSFSKTHTLTGDRCGWVAFSDPGLAEAVNTGWINTVASLPAEWQLRYTAYAQLFRERPELGERIRALYAHRRARFNEELRQLNAERHLFAHVNLDDGGTVYNWSQLAPGQDVFSLFCESGIAGVPGGGFGYSDDFVRFSIGCVPVAGK